MKQFIGTKLVKALPMNRQEYNDFRGWQLPSNENGGDEGYLVEYTDGGKPNTETYEGYVSWSPKEQFDNAYSETSGMTFSHALDALKKGRAVFRAGWNGAGQYVIQIPGEHLARSAGYGFGQYIGEFTFADVLALKNAQDIMQPGWVPSQGDLFAKDWQVVE